MDVISNTGSVWGGIIVSVHCQVLELADSNLGNIWHQVVRNACRVLADSATLVCTNWVKVPKIDSLPILVGLTKVSQDLLDEELCASIWIRRTDWSILGNLVAVLGCIPVHSGRGGKHDGLAPTFPHALEEIEGTSQVVLIVLKRFLHRLSDCFERGKMNNCIKLLLLRVKKFFHCRLVPEIQVMVFHGLSRDFHDSFQRFWR
mmetsp:Transcript_49979/g.156440  ORF Transcript_49979/g.156440 Transcript_49979/m.156440 type:complete len:203 (+) Transcript_49979:411-1019(+)